MLNHYQVCFVVSYIISDTPLVFNSKNTTPINIRLWCGL
jgi:hypothetical protein